MSNFDFSIPRRQSSKGVVLYFVLAAQKLIRGFWPVLLIYFFKNESLSDRMRMFVMIGAIVLLIILLVHAIFSYLRFYFFIEDDEFKVTKGYIKKVSLSIPLDRIQTINSKQNIFQQWLNIVSVEIDTAGAATKELKIIALDKISAAALTDQLNAAKSQSDPIIETEEAPVLSKKQILKLSFVDLIKVGISENHLKSSLIVVAFVFGLVDQLKDYFTTTYESTTVQAKDFIQGSDLINFLILFVFILFIGLIFSIVRILLQHYDLNFSRQGQKFHLRSGLLNKKSQSIPYSKIQVLTWRTNPIRKLLDFVTLNLSQATSSEENKKQSIEIPGCSSKHLLAVHTEIFPGHEYQSWDTHHSHRNFALRLFLLIGVLPIIPALIFAYMHWPLIILASAWLAITLVLSFLAHKKRYFRISADLIESSSGSVGQKFMRMFNYKVQSLRYSQSWFQRRKNLASIRIFTAGGKVLSIPYIDSKLAYELYNYLLFKVESSNEKWM